MTRYWRLLDARDRRRVLWVLPLLVAAAAVEVVGVAAVIPFVALLADPGGLDAVPIVGGAVRGLGVDDPAVLLRWMAVAVAVLVLAANALVMATVWWVYRFVWGLNHRLGTRLLHRYLSQPYGAMLGRNSAELSNRVVVQVQRLMTHGYQSALEIVTRSVVIVALVGFLVVLDPLLALVAFTVLGGAYAVIFGLSRRRLNALGREAVDLGERRLRALSEALGGFKDLKVSGRERSAFAKFADPSGRYAAVEAAAQAITMLPRYALEAVAVGGMVLVAAIMSVRSGAFAATLPVLAAYAFAGMRLMPLMQQLFTALARSRFALGALEDVEADLAHAPGDPRWDRVAPLPFEHAIELQEVTYAYPGERRLALDGVSLTVGRRSSVALVGRTGAGKSTAADVLLGLLQPRSGSVTVDGVAVTDENRRAYQQLFGYVPQHVFLLDDTISRNVAYGLRDDEIDPEAVRRACALAQIAAFIESELEAGYDTVVGERGIRLSGGQRQRLGIARALYHGPDVLVFDEATSALDVHTERALHEALETLSGSHAIVTIAHRLETVRRADHVVVLEGGRVVDRGPADGVLARYGRQEEAGDGGHAGPDPEGPAAGGAVTAAGGATPGASV